MVSPPPRTIVEHIRDVLLQAPLCQNLRPGQLLTLLDSWLEPVWNEQGRFVTAQAFLLESSGDLVGSNAGIPEPWQRTSAPICLPWNLPAGSPLGLVTGLTHGETVLPLSFGHGLLAFTDGVSEAGNPQFGIGQLDPFLIGDPTGAGLVGRLFDALRQHLGSRWPDDDTTAFWLERNPARTTSPTPAT